MNFSCGDAYKKLQIPLEKIINSLKCKFFMCVIPGNRKIKDIKTKTYEKVDRQSFYFTETFLRAIMINKYTCLSFSYSVCKWALKAWNLRGPQVLPFGILILNWLLRNKRRRKNLWLSPLFCQRDSDRKSCFRKEILKCSPRLMWI